MSFHITLSAVQLVWIVAAIAECFNSWYWWLEGKNSRGSSGPIDLSGMLEGVVWLLISLVILVIACAASWVLK